MRLAAAARPFFNSLLDFLTEVAPIMDREEDCYLRAVAETLTEWNSPEDEDAWRDEALGEQRSASEQEPPPGNNLESSVRARFAPLGGVELDPPPDEPVREPPL